MLRLRPLIDTASWWLLERPIDGGLLRRRVLAVAGLWILIGGMLVALGFGAVAVAASAVLLAVALTVGSLWLLLRPRARAAGRAAFEWVVATRATLGRRLRRVDLHRRLPRAAGGVAVTSASFRRLIRAGAPVVHKSRVAIAASARRHSQRVAAGSRRHSRSVAAGSRRSFSRTQLRTRAAAARSRRGYASATAKLVTRAREARSAAGGLASHADAKPTPAGRRRDALRLNAAGSQLRRAGDHAQAAVQHRRALAIVRDVGDKRLEALTLNDLALALVHTEGAAAAVEHFEQALAVLRELGDDEHEGRVTANLAFAHRRQGHTDEAEGLLQTALTKLAPDSSAYRRVEEQLRRAS